MMRTPSGKLGGEYSYKDISPPNHTAEAERGPAWADGRHGTFFCSAPSSRPEERRGTAPLLLPRTPRPHTATPPRRTWLHEALPAESGIPSAGNGLPVHKRRRPAPWKATSVHRYTLRLGIFSKFASIYVRSQSSGRRAATVSRPRCGVLQSRFLERNSISCMSVSIVLACRLASASSKTVVIASRPSNKFVDPQMI